MSPLLTVAMVMVGAWLSAKACVPTVNASALMKLRFRREKVGVIRYYGFAIDQEAAIEVAVQLDAKKCKPPAQGKLP